MVRVEGEEVEGRVEEGGEEEGGGREVMAGELPATGMFEARSVVVGGDRNEEAGWMEGERERNWSAFCRGVFAVNATTILPKSCWDYIISASRQLCPHRQRCKAGQLHGRRKVREGGKLLYGLGLHPDLLLSRGVDVGGIHQHQTGRAAETYMQQSLP